MKKRIILPLLTLAVAFAAVGAENQAAFADSTVGDEIKVWSLDETKAIYEEFEAKRTEACGENTVCRRTYLNELKQQDSKYGVVNSFARTTFMVTAINPEENYLKVFFRDLDYNSWENRGQEVRRALTELYLCWLDPDYEVASFSAAIRQGVEEDGLHPIARIVSNVNGSSWFPTNTEVEIHASGANLANNTKNTVYFSAWMGGSSFTNYGDYSACINSPDYTPGTECRIAFKDSGGYTYLPFKENTPVVDEPTPGNDNTETSDAAPTNEQSSTDAQPATVTVEKIVYRDSSTAISSASDGRKQSIGVSAASDAVASTGSATKSEPSSSKNETGNNRAGTSVADPLAAQAVELPTSGDKERETIFPWWFIVLVIAADVVIMWFFWPKKRES